MKECILFSMLLVCLAQQKKVWLLQMNNVGQALIYKPYIGHTTRNNPSINKCLSSVSTYKNS